MAVFVHGGFWHGHDCARGRREPKTRREYWLPKIARNRERDAAALSALAAAGLRALVVWECELSAGVAEAAAILRSSLSDCAAGRR